MLEPGEQIDIWVVEKALGSGGMGSVYRCHNRTASRILAAVKVLESGVRRHPEAEARFIREAEILFQLDHPNIVKVRNIRTDADPPYLEMEFVEGESLESRLQRGALPYDESVRVMEQIASAVEYLHKKGVRHRDIKPANLLLKKDGKVKLVDFGLAMEADVSRITQQGVTFGTVSYAPPEWIAPDSLDAAKWDVYAIGVVFYEMLTGRVAFPVSGQGSVRQQAMQVIVGKQGHKPLDPGDHFHDDVRQLISDMTHGDASMRLGDAAAVHRRIQALRRELKREAGVTIAPPVAFSDEDDESPSVVRELPTTPQLESQFGGGRHGSSATWVATEGPGADGMPAERVRGSEVGLADAITASDAEPVSQVPTAVGAPWRQQTPMPAPSLLDAATAPALAPRRRPPIDSLDHPVGAPPSAGRRLAPVLLVTASLALAALVVVAGIAAAAITASSAPRPRPVDVVVTGLPHAVPVGVKIGDQLASASDGAMFSFPTVALGEREVAWVIGKDCPVEACPGLDCPAWCVTGSNRAEIKAGSTPQIVTLALEPPVGRDVRLPLPPTDGLAVAVKLDEQEARVDESGARFASIAPGRHRLAVSLGACEAADPGCWPDGSCPAGCTSYLGDLVVPAGSGDFLHDLEIPAPERPKAAVARGPRPSAEPAAGRSPKAAASGGAAGRAVTNAELAAWLRSNPDWQADAAIAAGRADPGYLDGWDGAVPPPGREHHAATSVSWYAASAFCRSRGGLAGSDAAPERWTESDTQPWIEFRIEDGKAAWKSNDGRTSTSLNLKTANGTMGFRCAR